MEYYISICREACLVHLGPLVSHGCGDPKITTKAAVYQFAAYRVPHPGQGEETTPEVICSFTRGCG